jgi:hypothetical protein
MRNPTAILTILTVLAGAAACRADHVLDQAGQALAQGNVTQAVELYRQANADFPTAEGYNNFGIALERSRQFADAAAAYSESLLLPEPAAQTKINLKRAHVRAFIQSGLPYAARIFGGLLSGFGLIWLTKRLIQLWRAWQFRTSFQCVHAVSLTHRVHCSDGQYQPDGKAYPDSDCISFKADLVLPARDAIYPLHVELEIVSPDGAIWRTLRETVEAVEIERLTMWFHVDEVADLLMHSGVWNARLVLRNINKSLVTDAIVVVTRADLVADLQTSDARVIAVQGGRAESERVIFPDVEALVPTAVIRLRCCHPSKFAGVRLRLDLVNVEKPDDTETQEFPLDFVDGTMEFCTVHRQVAGNEIARKLGQWEFRLSVEGRQLAIMPFVITSIEQALGSMRVKKFEIAGIARSGGRAAPIRGVAHVQNLRALCPVVTVTSELPSPRAGFHMTMAVCVNDEPIGGVEGMQVMDHPSVELIPGEFTLPGIPDGTESMRISFVLMVEGRTLAIREMTVRLKPRRCADAQGRIIASPPAGEIDYDEEAARILQNAALR